MEVALPILLNNAKENYVDVFNYVLENQTINDTLKVSEKMEYIARSTIASYEEKLAFICGREDFTFQEKVWYSFLIPDAPYEDVFGSLLSIENTTEKEVIEYAIDCDFIPFSSLFDSILKAKKLDSAELASYCRYYYVHSDFNSTSLEEIGSYIFNLDYLKTNEQANCIWVVLDDFSLEEKTNFVLNYFHMNYYDYLNLYKINRNNFTKEQEILFSFFELANQEKEAYVLNHFVQSEDELNSVAAGVAAEGANSYEDYYWVSNVLFNRGTHPYYSKHGINPYNQFVAPSQFSVYGDGSYLRYLNPNPTHPGYRTQFYLAKQAFLDMFYNNYNGIRHQYTQFRSWDTVDYSDNYIVVGGNRYGSEMSERDRIEYPALVNDYEESDELVLKRTT